MSQKIMLSGEQFEAMREAICAVYDGENIMGESICGVTSHKRCTRAANAALKAINKKASA